MNQKIALIGLGEMGFPMAENLQKTGFNVYGFDINKEIYNNFDVNGFTGCESVKEAAMQTDDTIITVVRTADQTRSVIFGEDGITSSGKEGLKIIVMSTLDPNNMRELAHDVEEAGHILIDAPISGSLSGAEAATLTVMSAGDKAAVESVRPYFDAIGKTIFYFGADCGSGQAAKLTNNLMLAINIVANTEALKFGRENGLEQKDILKLIEVSTGDNWSSRNWEEISNNYTPETALGIVYKDLTAILNECATSEIALPLAGLTMHRLYNSMEEYRKNNESNQVTTMRS